MKKIAIVGAGGFAREVLWLLTDLGLKSRVGGFFETDEIWREREVSGLPVAPISSLDSGRWEAVLAVGSPAVRRNLRDALPKEITYPTLVHPSVQSSRRVDLAPGVVVCAGSILTCDIVVSEHVHLNLATTVGHDCQLRPFVTTAPAVNISGACDIGELTYIGTNAALREGLKIAAGTTIGMGAIVVSHIEEAGVYVGNPAKKLPKK
ncbi:NeuD/PglB/VioB family sugar acetyltransferase [Pseudoxanthomonas mexicana]|uniref:NeuD/PglB/VioB family sugar acetyltransferase n=1 Tax=Pseudoxanthomonas mexicana TaxID=128785 RepID=A0A7G9TGC2_PSEMX|nr:NeuD/PglB/VioB family sugar acetyltransferase [Pseudoxanthomonas mexicana]QNN79147.1 NeuD/PglB/VioB family sugar acetyltransferase [Pseudoxanthomonas mexicana]